MTPDSAPQGHTSSLHELRARAERLAENLHEAESADKLSVDEVRQLLHELVVHQIELEMQNQELLQAQQMLERSRHQFWTFFEKAPVGYVTLDHDGLLQEVNGAFSRLVGREPSRLKGRPFQELLAEPDRPIFLGRFRAFQRHPEGKEIECTLVAADGERLEVRLNGATVEIAESGEATGCLLLTVHDVTWNRHLERQLARAQRMESLGSLAGGVAHDMNNVLAAVMSVASAYEDAGDPELARSMETVTHACVRGRTLVHGLLDFARRGLSRTAPVDLNALVLDTVALLEHTTLQRIRLATDLAPDLQTVSGDASSLGQTVMNLCLNAVDAMPQGGALTLTTRNDEPNRVLLEVRDSGQGMSAAVLEHAFDPFFTTKSQGRGTGLGLAIVYGCVQAHGGQVDLQSEVGKGTTVTVTLPATSASAPAPPQPPQPPGRSEPLRVLAVDDDDAVRRGLEFLLQRAGHQVVMAAGGEEALVLLQGERPFDVAILDVNMPGLDGLATLPRLRELRPRLPVLLFTGAPDDRTHEVCRQHDRVRVLPKPVRAKELQAHLSSLIRGD